jgi:hypothetical protein
MRKASKLALMVGAYLALNVALHAQETQSPPAPRPGAASGPGEGAPAEAAPGDLFNQPGRCQDCHIDEAWDRIKAPEGFDHAATGFPLRFAHAEVSCDGCHRRGLDALTSACSACHHDPHAGLNTLMCERCHQERTWDVPRNFQAHEATRFPLTGAHAVVACEACHRPRRAEPLQTTPMECFVCHRRNWQRARPDHAAAQFTECGDCHTTSTFRGATYVHRSYVLDGAHALQRCTTCHTGSVFAGLAQAGQDCRQCHISDFNRTATIGPPVPDHPAGGALFSGACLTCHLDNRNSWDINGN